MKLKELKSVFIIFGVLLVLLGFLMLLIFLRDGSYFYQNSYSHTLSFIIDALSYVVLALGVALLIIVVTKILKFRTPQIIIASVVVIILSALLLHFTFNAFYRFNSSNLFSAVVVAKEDAIAENNISVMANGQTIQLYGARAMINLVDVGDFWGVVTYKHPANDFSWGYIEKIDFPVKYGAIWSQPGAALTGAAIGVAAPQ